MSEARMVQTAKGLLPFGELEIREVRGDGENEVSIAREWYWHGELVRRDAWVTLLRGNPAATDQGKLNGE